MAGMSLQEIRAAGAETRRKSGMLTNAERAAKAELVAELEAEDATREPAPWVLTDAGYDFSGAGRE